MCLYNYNKEKKKYKHLTYAERTIRREISRWLVTVKGYLWEDKVEYSARIVQEKEKQMETMIEW